MLVFEKSKEDPDKIKLSAEEKFKCPTMNTEILTLGDETSIDSSKFKASLKRIGESKKYKF